MDKGILNQKRKREIQGSFGWIEHRFVREDYIKKLSSQEILLYFFLAVVADNNGISFYGPDRTMSLLNLKEADYFQALAALEAKDHICRQGNKIQLMSLPKAPNKKPVVLRERYQKTLSLAQILQACPTPPPQADGGNQSGD